MKLQREEEAQLLLSSALNGLCQLHAPPDLPCESTPVHAVQEAEWTPGPVRSGTEKKNLLRTPEFIPRTAQPLASPYTEYAVPVPEITNHMCP
jgi:hypothetical protein